MRKTIAALAVLAMLVAGCGNSGSQTDTAAAKRAAARRAAAIKAARLRARQQADYDACKATFGKLEKALGELDSRLSIGLTYADYGTEVADVQVAYDQLDIDNPELTPECVGGVGVPLERSLNQHLRAQNMWSDCFDDWDCDPASIEPDLQARWEKAGRLVEKANRNLAEIAPPGEPLAASDYAADSDPFADRVMNALTAEQEAALDEAIGELLDSLRRHDELLDDGDRDVSCAEWLVAPNDIQTAFAIGAVGGDGSGSDTFVKHVTDGCMNGTTTSAAALIAREILVNTGKVGQLHELDRP